MMKKTGNCAIAVFAVCVSLLLAFAGCNGTKGGDGSDVTVPPPASSEPQEETGNDTHTSGLLSDISDIGVDNYPSIYGSTANLPLMVKLYSEICGVPEEDAAEAMAGAAVGTSDAWWSMFLRREPGEPGGLLIVYEAPENIKNQIEDEGIRLEIEPVGRDGLVFLVNRENKVNDLSTKQLQDIYTGKVTDWKDIGGEAGPIVAYQRNENSGSHTLFLKLLMKGLEPMEAPGELVSGMEGLVTAVAEFDGAGDAIGYSVFYYADMMYANPDVKLLSVDGVMPSNETIASGAYPFVNDFYVVIHADEPEGSPARILRDWLLTDKGAELMRSANYVPIR